MPFDIQVLVEVVHEVGVEVEAVIAPADESSAASD